MGHVLTRDYDLVAVGGGVGGLVSAAGAAYLGLRAAIVERDRLGGDCLWTGCVPSKALIASARLARRMEDAGDLGLRAAPARVHGLKAVMERMRTARAAVARHDDPERFRAMGVAVHFGAAKFRDATTLEVEGEGLLRSKRFVLATGAEPWAPPAPGLEEAGYWTYETVFDQDELPGSLIVLGGGPVGVELAQTFSRLGSKVTILEAADRLLGGEDPEASAHLAGALAAEGIEVRTGTTAASVRRAKDGRWAVALATTDMAAGVATAATADMAGVATAAAADMAAGAAADMAADMAGLAADMAPGVAAAAGRRDGSARGAGELVADRILVATGRRPRIGGLGLEAAGVETRRGGVRVDARLRTTAKTIWAAGDVTGGPQFTHAAEHMAKTALRNAVLPFKAKPDWDAVPRVTYSDPEVAHVGLGAEEAEAAGGQVYRYDLADLDRAVADGAAAGFAKISADRKGRILGATIVAKGAGELLAPVLVARQNGLSLSRVAQTIFPYPTMAESVKRASNEFMRARLDHRSGRLLKRVVSWLK